jgi:hypothetical protein
MQVFLPVFFGYLMRINSVEIPATIILVFFTFVNGKVNATENLKVTAFKY